MEETLTENVDLISTIVNIINQIFTNLLSSIDKNIFPLLDDLVFIDKGIIDTGDRMNKILSTSPTNGVLLLANCLFTAFVLYYAAKLMIAQVSGSSIESPPRFFIRAFLTGVTMNYSVQICSFLLESAWDITSFFCSLGESIFGEGEISFVTLNSLLNSSITDSFDAFSLDGILSRHAVLLLLCSHHQLCFSLYSHQGVNHPVTVCHTVPLHTLQ